MVLLGCVWCAGLFVGQHIFRFGTRLYGQVGGIPMGTGCAPLGPELQCLLKVKEDLCLVFIFQDAKNNVSN